MVNIHLLMKRKGAIAEFFFEPIDQQVIFVLHLIHITFKKLHFPSQVVGSVPRVSQRDPK